MHIKHQKKQRKLVAAWLPCGWSRQWTLFFLGCFELCVERLYWLRARGHHSRATFTSRHPKARGRRHFWTDVLYLSSTPAGELSRSEASASVWPAASPDPLFSSPLVGAHSSLQTVWKGRGWRIRRLGDYQTWPRWFVFNRGRGGRWVLEGGGWGVERRWVVAGADRLSLWVGGGVLALLGARLGLQILVVLGLDVLVLVRGDGTLQVGPVGWQNHQVVDLKRNGDDLFIYVTDRENNVQGKTGWTSFKQQLCPSSVLHKNFSMFCVVGHPGNMTKWSILKNCMHTKNMIDFFCLCWWWKLFSDIAKHKGNGTAAHSWKKLKNYLWIAIMFALLLKFNWHGLTEGCSYHFLWKMVKFVEFLYTKYRT